MQQMRVVGPLPDEDQMRCSHEAGDERTPGRRTRKGIRAHAEPAAAVRGVLVLPELLLPDKLRVRQNAVSRLDPPLLHREKATRQARPASGTLGPGSGRLGPQPQSGRAPGAPRCAPTRAPIAPSSAGTPVAASAPPPATRRRSAASR